MKSSDLRPIYDYNKPLGKDYIIKDIFVDGSEMDIETGKEMPKGINITVIKKDDEIDLDKGNWNVITVNKSQLLGKQYTIIQDFDNIKEVIEDNYMAIERAYKKYCGSVKKRQLVE